MKNFLNGALAIITITNSKFIIKIFVGCLVEYIPTKLVESSIRQIVGDATISDVEMFIALKCMVSWLAWPTQKKADLWVLAFFQELAKASKFTLLIEVTMNTIKQVINAKAQLDRDLLSVQEVWS